MCCLLVVCTAAPVAAAGNRLLEDMNDARLRFSLVEEPGATDHRGHRPIAVRRWAGWGVADGGGGVGGVGALGSWGRGTAEPHWLQAHRSPQTSSQRAPDPLLRGLMGTSSHRHGRLIPGHW